MTLNQLLSKLTKKKIHSSWGYFGSSSKNIYNLLKIMLHIIPWTLILMLHIRQSIYLVLTNLLSISFWCPTLHLMKSVQHCLYNSGIKVNMLDTCGAMICSYFGIAFLLFFMKIENAVYTSCQNSTLLFINGLIFDIMNTQNQSLEFEWKPMLAPVRFVNDQRFSWLRNVLLKLFQDWLNSVQKRQGNFERDADQKMFIW